MVRKVRAEQNAVPQERKPALRFPIECNVHYRVCSSGRKVSSHSGHGKTLEMSNRALLFTADTPLPLGKQIEVSVDWPVKLDGKCRLKLVISGRIVNADGTKAVVALKTHEFRTQGA